MEIVARNGLGERNWTFEVAWEKISDFHVMQKKVLVV